MSTQIVLDCSFGDAGKGLVVDNLCGEALKSKPASEIVVVRFSGGQQCGHTVMHDGKKHIFSSYGSGSLRGIKTYATEHTTMYVPNLCNEYRVLEDKGITPQLTFHPLAMVTTPYDVAFNRAKEQWARNGSCGLGVGATMHRNITSPHKLFANDFLYPSIMLEKLSNIRDYYRKLVWSEKVNPTAYSRELGNIEENFFDDVENLHKKEYFRIGNINPSKDATIIFEGSQGIFLDMDHGVFPNVTYALTTCRNAISYCYLWQRTPEMFYVTRCYTTRHGRGWMPKEAPIELVNNQEEINKYNEWQEDFRYGEFDYNLVNHAIGTDSIYHGLPDAFKKNLVVTCLDQRPEFALDKSKFNNIDTFWGNNSPLSDNMKTL